VRALERGEVIPETGQVALRGAGRPELALELDRPPGPQGRHQVQGLERHTAVPPAAGVQAEEVVVGRQGADSDPELVTPLCHVVEVGDPVGELHRVVIRQQVA
jgi:hypothetical protein